jgi:hypothetical protein
VTPTFCTTQNDESDLKNQVQNMQTPKGIALSLFLAVDRAKAFVSGKILAMIRTGHPRP